MQTSCVDHKDRNDMWPTAAFAYSFTMPTVLQSIQKNFTQSVWLPNCPSLRITGHLPAPIVNGGGERF